MMMSHLKRIVVFACLAAGTACAGTTGLLEGRITNKKTHEPLPGANVRIVGTQQGASSDTAGLYQVANIRSGVYTIQFSIVGYRSVLLKDVTVLPDLRTRIDMELEPTALEMEAIEVRAERPLIQKDLPATAYSIGETQFNRLPVTVFQDVLGLQPGTTMEGNVRGGKTNEVLYLVDGLPVQDVISGGLGANLPKSSITGLTIYTGGFEAQYGNAMSGVVNVLTKTGSNRHEFGVRVERDSWLPTSLDQQVDRRSEFEVTAGGPLNKGEVFYFTANTLTMSGTRWWQDFDKFGISSVQKDFTGFSKLEYVLSPRMRFGLQGVYSFRREHEYEFSWRFNLRGLPETARDSYRLALTFSNSMTDNIFYTVSLSRYYQRSRIGQPIPNTAALVPYQYDFFLRYIVEGTRNWWADTRQAIYTFKGDITAQMGRSHIFKAGVELNQFTISSDLVKFEPQTTYFGKPIIGADLLNYSNSYRYLPRSGSVYMQDKVEFVRDGSNLSFGVRWDFLDPTAQRPVVEYIPVRPNEYRQQVTGTVKATFKHQLSPRVAFAAPVGPSSFFFINLGSYFQYPLFDYLYAGINPSQIRLGTRSVLTGNPDLAPERAVAWEIGLKHGVNNQVVVSSTYFRKRITNQVDSKTLIPFDSKSAGDYGYASYVNNATADVNGLELMVSREHGEKFSGSVSYTYMVTEGLSDNVNQAVNIAQWGFPIPARPYPLSWDQRHTVKADVDVETLWGIKMNAVLLFNSPRPYTFFPTRDGFTPVDSTRDFLPNNRRMENVWFVNLKVSKEFAFGNGMPGYRVLVYGDIRNLMNASNIRWVDSNGRIGGELGDPGAYYDPRRVRVGVQVDF